MRVEIVTIALAEAANRGYVIPPANQVNLRGRCAFGRPCDNHKLSYGCEIFSNDAETDAPKGVCWSECTGYLPRSNGEGAFMYEGWCYNLNSKHSMAAELSGKKNRHRRARMSEEEMIAMEEAKVEAQEEDIALEEYNGMISEFDSGFLIDRPLELYETCSQDSDCAEIAKMCAIGCSNQVEYNEQ
ncbi:Oidioi.mRNA.OKI2018_I69.PAR.g8819.t1.cds [Oikopleura dioica]|uniref:Oidioi.mRNA.OKI2018_I69.PAR.g8819.t1.cds n=1 Tax=Oikopleura dioica TaxID=34765 RepID=A0ABN7RNP9_OIKDI|nr:Oidioi.mRNA.OKI2018_I69.PAR.g8819.t1.cds [Oikopleura dioica]